MVASSQNHKLEDKKWSFLRLRAWLIGDLQFNSINNSPFASFIVSQCTIYC